MQQETPELSPISILNAAADEVALKGDIETGCYVIPLLVLTRAIKHLSRPDRDVYPKSRWGTKNSPVRALQRPSSVDMI